MLGRADEPGRCQHHPVCVDQHVRSKRREDVAVAESPRSCSVCQRPRTRGSYDPAHDVFICAECMRDAKQFIEIQDSIWEKAGGDEPRDPVIEA